MSYEYLQHYGIKGQRWGIRRFQNEDGSLTDAGKARIAKKAPEYLPSKSTGLYNTVKFDKKGKIKSGANRLRLSELFAEDDIKRTWEENKKAYDSLKNKWASATLKDLGLKDSPKGRRDVKAVLKDIDPGYTFELRRPYKDEDILSETQLKEFRKRKKEISHPVREKVKGHAEKAKKVIDAASSIKKLVF